MRQTGSVGLVRQPGFRAIGGIAHDAGQQLIGGGPGCQQFGRQFVAKPLFQGTQQGVADKGVMLVGDAVIQVPDRQGLCGGDDLFRLVQAPHDQGKRTQQLSALLLHVAIQHRFQRWVDVEQFAIEDLRHCFAKTGNLFERLLYKVGFLLVHDDLSMRIIFPK
jgi:hypothetical protein